MLHPQRRTVTTDLLRLSGGVIIRGLLESVRLKTATVATIVPQNELLLQLSRCCEKRNGVRVGQCIFPLYSYNLRSFFHWFLLVLYLLLLLLLLLLFLLLHVFLICCPSFFPRCLVFSLLGASQCLLLWFFVLDFFFLVSVSVVAASKFSTFAALMIANSDSLAFHPFAKKKRSFNSFPSPS